MDRPILVVTAPAEDTSLLTIEEIRTAAGVTNGARDTELRGLAAQITASIMAECNIAIGAGAEPTLRQETLTDTFYHMHHHVFSHSSSAAHMRDLVLSRRHNVVVSTVTIDGVVVDPAEYVVEAESGMLTRLSDGLPCHWHGGIIVVIYQAGFETVPADLKLAATSFFRAMLAESKRDPFVKMHRQQAPNVFEEITEYWVGSIPGQANEGAVPDIVAGQLKRFRNKVFG